MDSMRMSCTVLAVWVFFGLVGDRSVKSAFADGDQVLISTVPKAAKKAAVAAVKGLTLTKAEMEKEADRTVYELTGNADGKTNTVEVTQEGKILKVEEGNTDREKVPLASVPKAVSNAAVAAVKGLKLTEAEVEVEGNRTVYELKGATRDSLFHWSKTYRIRVSADGKLITVDEEKEANDEQD